MNLTQDIAYAIKAHATQSKTKDKSLRLWDKKTPYYIHPIWCATTILTETSLPARLRTEGAQTLLYHDILEDTRAPLPAHLSPSVVRAIQDMTFKRGIMQEMKLIWTKPPQIQLFKLYDKVSNLLDGVWMPKDLKKQYRAYTKKLLRSVEKHFGSDLNIVRIAHTILDS
jgi:(p)ppGpp synthase/HD superfamily hydrolase